MKSLLLAAVALSLPGLAWAQTSPAQTPDQTRPLAQPASGGVAAATLPNTFDGPPAAARPAPAPVTAPATAAVQSDAETIAAAEQALKATIAAAQQGSLNYDDMTPSLAEQIRERADMVVSMIEGFGTLQSVEHRGSQEGMEMFLVTFDEAVTQWVIGLDADEKIVGLLFRPAEAVAETAPDASDD